MQQLVERVWFVVWIGHPNPFDLASFKKVRASKLEISSIRKIYSRKSKNGKDATGRLRDPRLLTTVMIHRHTAA
jgi:hypothetical protein